MQARSTAVRQWSRWWSLQGSRVVGAPNGKRLYMRGVGAVWWWWVCRWRVRRHGCAAGRMGPNIRWAVTGARGEEKAAEVVAPEPGEVRALAATIRSILIACSEE